MIRKTEDGCFVISAYGVWRPGAFASETAARAGQRLKDQDIQQLQDAAIERGGDRIITLEDIHAYRRRAPAPQGVTE